MKMSDLVNRLRTSNTNGKLCDEAADRIEGLRVALVTLMDACNQAPNMTGTELQAVTAANLELNK